LSVHLRWTLNPPKLTFERADAGAYVVRAGVVAFRAALLTHVTLLVYWLGH
jgi:hypothetical protein